MYGMLQPISMTGSLSYGAAIPIIMGQTIGTFVMLFNTLLYIICGIAIQSWILPLYSIVTYYVGSRTVDFITEGFDRAKCAMIVTVKANEISNALSENFDSSGTIVKIFRLHTKTYKPRIVKNHGSGYFFCIFLKSCFGLAWLMFHITYVGRRMSYQNERRKRHGLKSKMEGGSK